MAIIVASWNIEKNGQSSTDIKQGKVSDFLARCCSYGITVIFLCEVHSSRIADYTSYCASVYGGQLQYRFVAGRA